MNDRQPSIRWIPLPREVMIAADEAKPLSPQARALFDAGVPVAPGATTAREQAISLLQVAAEIEHALMVQYLYLAMSVETEDKGVVLQIAIEEMAHLATVQNLLILLDGPRAVHMQRDVLRASSEHNPIPFVLEPMSRGALAKYIAAEAPAVVPAALADQVEELLELARVESGVSPNRVGAIYALLQWMFSDPQTARTVIDLAALLPAGSLPEQPHLSDADFQSEPTISAYEMSRPEWEIDRPDYIVLSPRTCDQAAAGIAKIGAQGEGAESVDNSHFLRFLALVDRFEAGEIAVSTLPVSPKVDGHGGERPVEMTNSYTRLWGRAFNAQYGLVVLGIFHAAKLSRNDPAEGPLREELAALTMRGMRTVLMQVAGVLAKLPIAVDGSGIAGPPFELDPSILPEAAADLNAAQVRLLDTAAAIYTAIETDAAHQGVGDAANRLRSMRTLDQKRRDLFKS